MCIRVVKVDPCALEFVPDWLVVLQEMWCEDFDDSIILLGGAMHIKKGRSRKH